MTSTGRNGGVRLRRGAPHRALYGIITFGLILAAQATITQAAADGARAHRDVVRGGWSVHRARRPLADSRSPSRHRRRVDEQGHVWTASTTITCVAQRHLPVECEQRVPDSESHLQLQFEPALPEMPGLSIVTRRPSRRPTRCRSRPELLGDERDRAKPELVTHWT